MSSLRTFIAVETSPQVRERAGALMERLRAADADVKWVGLEHLHFTLKFLGNVDITATAEVCRRVAGAAAEVAPFEVRVAGAGAFPSADRPRTVWLGLDEGREAMVNLALAIEDALEGLGYRRENRPFSPHLTLGRTRGARGALADLLGDQADFVAGPLAVQEVVIFSSELTPAGPIHRPLGRGKLG